MYFWGVSKDMLFHLSINNFGDHPDDSDIHKPRSPQFLHTKRGVMDESGYTAGGSDKYIVSKTENSGANNKRRFWRKDSFIHKILKSKRGISLIEVMAVVLIFSIIITGGFYHFVYGRSQIELQRHYRVAVQLAAQKLEELNAGNYNDIEVGQTDENLTLEGFSYTRSTETEDVGLYKNVNVTVQWEQMGKEHDVSLATCVAPQ